MRLLRLDLLSYGHLRDVSLDLAGPPNGLTVVVGPNEAGKSTAMRALDSFLFGIERGNSDHFGLGRPSLRVGGRLRAADGSTLGAVRQGLAKAPLVDDDGNPIPQTALLAMLGQTDRALFRTLFRVDHDELSNGSAALLETDGEIGRLVFGASLGSVALTDVLRELDARAQALFRPGAKKSLAHAALLDYRARAAAARDKRVKSAEWHRRDERRRATEARITTLQQLQRELRAEAAQLERVESALPLLTRRSRVDLQLDALLDAGAVESSAWAEAVGRLLTERTETGKERARSEEKHLVLTGQLDTIEVDDALLAAEQRIRELFGDKGRYDNNLDDLPDLERRLEARQGAVELVLGRLREHTTADPDELLALTEGQRREIGRLVADRPRIDAELDQAAAELRALARNIEAVTERRRDLVEPPDTSALSRAVDAARSLGPIEEQLDKRTSERTHLREEADALARRLGFGDTSLDDVVAVPVPARARVIRERRERADLAAARTELATRGEGLRDEREQLLEERAALEADLAVPDRSELESTRRHRDAGWQLVRSSLDGAADEAVVSAWAHDDPLPDAFEVAVERADAVADRRFDLAEQATTITRIAARLAFLDQRLAVYDDERADIDQRERTLDHAWAQEWAGLGGAGGDPDDAQEWLDDHRTLLELVASLRTTTSELALLAEQLEQREGLLRDRLEALAVEPESGGLTLLVRQADDLLATTRRDQEIWNREAQAFQALTDQRPDRERELDRAKRALATWSADWADAIEPLHFDGDEADPTKATTTVTLLLELRKERDARSDLSSRVTGLVADITAYEKAARAAIAELAPDLAHRDPATAVAEMFSRLKGSIERDARRQELVKQLDALAVEIAEARIAEAAATRSIAEQRTRASLAPEFDLSAVVARSVAAAGLRDQMTALETTLIDQGGGKSVEEIRLEADRHEMDGDRVATELARVRDELDDLDGQISDALTAKGEIDTLIAQIDGSGEAADLDQQAEESLALTAQLLDEYTRVALASALLKRVVSAYAEQHQRPILDDAVRFFRILTIGAFDDLVVDTEGAKQVLLAQRRNGETLGTAALSSGTRDQLYLALRLAGVCHHLESVDEPLPLILDDVLVNFDDERSAAALEALAEVARCTQVIMFTHEPSLARLALDTLGSERCSVVRLNPRNHDTPRPGAGAGP